MTILDCALSDYSVYKSMTWGNCREHYCLWKDPRNAYTQRKVHQILCIAEALPIISQIVSVVEMIFFYFYHEYIFRKMTAVKEIEKNDKVKSVRGMFFG